MSPLQLRNIREVWDAIRPGVERAIAKGGGYSSRPEDVYAACVHGDAFLWMNDEGDFAVLQLQKDEFTLEVQCFIWVAFNKGDRNAHTTQLCEIAREAGAERLVMSSSRRGWDRQSEWTPLYTTYAMEI